MTDHWRGAADQVARDLARVKDERNRLRREVERLRNRWETACRNGDEQAYRILELRSALVAARDAATWELSVEILEEVLRLPRPACPETETVVDRLRAQLAEAQVTIRALVGVPRVGDPPRPVDPHCDLSPDGQHLRGTGRDRGECRFCDVPMPIGPTLPPPTGEVP